MIKGRIGTLTQPINSVYHIETSPCLMDEDVLPKLTFVNEKNIKFFKENSYIDFLGEECYLHINIMLLRLFLQFPISFAVLLCYRLVGMRANLGTSFVLLLSYVLDRKKLLLSEYSLEKLFFFTCLITPHFSTGQNLLKKILRKDKYWQKTDREK